MLITINDPLNIPSTQPTEETCAIGIDLGTTHCAVAISDHQVPKVIPIQGHFLMPSRLVCHNNILYSVPPATEWNLKDQITSFKRFMPNPTQPLKQGKTPLELSATLLKFLKEEAEKFLNKNIAKAVITIPAYFDETARQATKDAAKIAGLEVLRLINEPTAAALAYGLDTGVEGLYGVYDLGGGTFDFSLLQMEKGVFRVLATGGDLTLGGDDIDQAITLYWNSQKLSHFLTQEEQLRKAKEAKESLSKHKKWHDDANSLFLDEEELKLISCPFLEKTLKVCELVLKDAKKAVDLLKGIVLVGGSTRLKGLQEVVEGFFHQKPLSNISPDYSVAFGAALQAEALTKGANTLLIDVTPLSLGVEMMGGIVEKIIHRNTPLPCSVGQEFTTYEDNQTGLNIHIVQGERELAKDCRSLGQFTLSGIPPMVAGAAKILITFHLDTDGLLTVTANETSTNISQSIAVKPSYGLSYETLEKMIHESFKVGKEDLDKRLLIESILKARQILKALEQGLKEDAHLLGTEEYSRLIEEMDCLRGYIEEKNRIHIQEQTKKLSYLSQPFAEKRIAHAISQKIVGQNIKN